LDQELPNHVGFEDDEYQFIPTSVQYPPPTPRPKRKPKKSTNPSDPYDLWADLARAKADISFGQLIQLAPLLRKQMREGATNRRLPKQVDHVNKDLEVMPDL